MSIHLVGGGWDAGARRSVYGPFLAEAAARSAASRRRPRVGVVIVHDGDGAARFEQFADILNGLGPCEPVGVLAPEGGTLGPEALDDLDALLVGGGLTPAYLATLARCFDRIRAAVHEGMPYLGFSAGAAIAADRAIIGGWMIKGRPVAAEEAAEDLVEVALAPGIGLVDFAVDVHAAQWGTATRLIAVVEAGLVAAGVGIDESTALIVSRDGGRVAGVGQIWQVQAGDDGVLVRLGMAD